MSKMGQGRINQMRESRNLHRRVEEEQRGYEKITLDMILYVGFPLHMLVSVRERCASDVGHWFCLTHDCLTPSLTPTVHDQYWRYPHTEDDQHLLAWFCQEHQQLEISTAVQNAVDNLVCP